MSRIEKEASEMRKNNEKRSRCWYIRLPRHVEGLDHDLIIGPAQLLGPVTEGQVRRYVEEAWGIKSLPEGTKVWPA